MQVSLFSQDRQSVPSRYSVPPRYTPVSPHGTQHATVCEVRTLPAAYRVEDLPPHIAARVTIHPETGCWRAGGNVDKYGYARLGKEGLHRVVYRLTTGQPIPPGYHVDHVFARGCRFRNCINPAHLEAVTPAENYRRRGLTSFAAVNAAKDICDHGHAYGLFTTYIKPNGHRDCRVCIRARVAKYQRKVRTGQHIPLRRAA